MGGFGGVGFGIRHIIFVWDGKGGCVGFVYVVFSTFSY